MEETSSSENEDDDDGLLTQEPSDHSSLDEPNNDDNTHHNMLTLQERRAKNMERNQAVLQRLGLAHGQPNLDKHKKKRKRPPETNNPTDKSTAAKEQPPSLLLPLDHTNHPKTPPPVRMMHCDSVMRQLRAATTRSILVSGRRGCGKTTLVRHLFPNAIYVHVGHYERLEALLTHVYRQVVRKYYSRLDDADNNNINNNGWVCTPPSLDAVWKFGCALQNAQFRQKEKANQPSVLTIVLDQAQRLFHRSSSSPNNPLAQLLLLPHTLSLNVQFVVISRSLLLSYTSLDNVHSQGTIGDHLSLLPIVMPAYRSKRVLVDILTAPHNRHAILGATQDNAKFIETVYHNFLDTLVQALFLVSSDLNEYLRVGKMVWKQYIAPLHPDCIQATLNKVETQPDTERALLSYLDQKIYPVLRQQLEAGLSVVTCPSVHVDMPLLAKYLFLAIFVCQTNRPDRDKQLFSVQKNGKRKKTQNTTGEDVAFGDNNDSLKSLRPRAFPAERLYSLYVSMVSLNPPKHQQWNQISSQPPVGDLYFQSTLSHFRDIGILHDYPSVGVNDAARLTQRSFYSSITRPEAETVAKSVDFPLDRYVL